MSALTKERIQEYQYQEAPIYKKTKKTGIKKKHRNKISIGGIKNAFLLIVTFLFGLSIVYNYACITEKKMEINNINKDIDQLGNEIDKYNIALERLKDTNKIEKMAKTYLGMNYPTRKQTVFIEVANDDLQNKNAQKDNGLGAKIYDFVDKVMQFIN